jgi:hypothetical protein
MSDTPNRIYIGSYEPGVTHLIVPRQVLAQANDRLDAERRARETAEAKARMQVLQQAKSRGRLRKALRGVFRGRGR